jgi:hypothetical protein
VRAPPRLRTAGGRGPRGRCQRGGTRAQGSTGTPRPAGTTLIQGDLAWTNSRLLPAGDAIGAVSELRERPGGDIQVMGSPSLASQLAAAELVDEYRLMIEPSCSAGASASSPTTAGPARSSWSPPRRRARACSSAPTDPSAPEASPSPAAGSRPPPAHVWAAGRGSRSRRVAGRHRCRSLTGLHGRPINPA